MNFKNNLKSELTYQGILVKELAARANVNKHTLDNYLSVNSYMPSAETAVKIARVLGVSVEYLVTGSEPERKRSQHQLSPEGHTAGCLFDELSPDSRKLVLSLIQTIKTHEKERKKG
jgi:transcriptional regulator with XRE-family HTH domain